MGRRLLKNERAGLTWSVRGRLGCGGHRYDNTGGFPPLRCHCRAAR